jgi:hypothetical protein
MSECLSHYRPTGQNHNVGITSISFENEVKFGTAVVNQSDINDKIRCAKNSEILAAFQFCLLFIVLYGIETWSVIRNEERTLWGILGTECWGGYLDIKRNEQRETLLRRGVVVGY